MAGKDKNKPPPATGRVSARDVLTRPASPDAASTLKTPPAEDILKMMGLDSKGRKLQVGTSTSGSASDMEAVARDMLLRPADPEAVKIIAEPDTDFQRFAKSLLSPRTNTADTLGPGEEFVEPTVDQILKAPALTELDILRAPPSAEALAALKVGVLSNRDGSDRIYLSGRSLDSFITKGGIPGLKNFQMMSFGEAQRDIANRYLGQIVEIKPGQLHPGLAERMRKDSDVALYANYAISAGQKAGIDGIMYANQLWQESRFNPDAVSGKGASGISQMMPYHQGKYGLQSRDDFFDPFKSIDAGAQMKFEMTNRYKDQRLALVAYNGGGGAIDFVERKLGKDQISYKDWHNFMEQRRAATPTNDPSAWQNETFDYLKKTGAGRPEDGSAKPVSSKTQDTSTKPQPAPTLR